MAKRQTKSQLRGEFTQSAALVNADRSIDLTRYSARGADIIPRTDDREARTTSPNAQQAAITRTHPLYDHWVERWRQLGWVYEGDGPYADGSALIPHVREILYGRNSDGTTDFDTVSGYKRKYLLRKQLARYENFAEQIVDLFADYQYAKPPERWIDNPIPAAPLTDWWKDVDGEGSSIDDWLRRHQVSPNVYGHSFVVMDRAAPNPTRYSFTPRGARTQPSLADLGRPVLRVYTPPDVLDWLAPLRRLTSVKVVEPVERTSLSDLRVNTESRYIIWDSRQWTLYDQNGALVRQGQHGMGMLPCVQWFAKRRSLQPMLGRSLLKDHTLFRDHYNLISEMRELLRAQVFSMLHITLSPDETIEQARDRLGDHAGTDTLIFTKAGAEFIAPGDGPTARYAEEIQSAERKMFRLVSLPWETDSSQPEAEGSRQLKTEDLNVKLAQLADRAEQVDMWVARAYYSAMLGPTAGPSAYESAGVTIRHPQKFHVEELAARAQDMKTVLDLGVGPTASRLLKLSVLNLALPGQSDEDRTAIETELTEQEERGAESAELDNEQKRVSIESERANSGRKPGQNEE